MTRTFGAWKSFAIASLVIRCISSIALLPLRQSVLLSPGSIFVRNLRSGTHSDVADSAGLTNQGKRALTRSFLLSTLVAALPQSLHAQAPVSNNDDFNHTFTSCAQSTVETLTIVQLAQRGVSRTDALDVLPASKTAKHRIAHVYDLISTEGMLNTYSFVNSNYARCARLVYERNGLPAADQGEYRYYFCAGENKVRYEVLLHASQKFDIDYVIANTPDTHFDTAIRYFKLADEQGLLAAFDYTANNLKACISPSKP